MVFEVFFYEWEHSRLPTQTVVTHHQMVDQLFSDYVCGNYFVNGVGAQGSFKTKKISPDISRLGGGGLDALQKMETFGDI